MGGNDPAAVRAGLEAIVADYKSRNIDLSLDPRRTEAIMLDSFPESPAEIRALVEAIRSGAVQYMCDGAGQGVADVVVERAAAQLADSVGLREDLCRWAAASWWLALDLDSSAPSRTIRTTSDPVASTPAAVEAAPVADAASAQGGAEATVIDQPRTPVESPAFDTGAVAAGAATGVAEAATGVAEELPAAATAGVAGPGGVAEATETPVPATSEPAATARVAETAGATDVVASQEATGRGDGASATDEVAGPGRRKLSRRLVLACAVGVLVVGGVIAAVVSRQSHSQGAALLSDQAWVVNNNTGQLTVVNETTGAPKLYLNLGLPGQSWTVLVMGSIADLYNSGAHTLQSLDFGSRSIGPPASVAGAQVVRGSTEVWVVYQKTGEILALNPLTNVEEASFPISGPTSGAVTDSQGNLYFLNKNTGAVVELSLSGHTIHETEAIGTVSPGSNVQVGLLNGSPDVLDLSKPEMVFTSDGSVSSRVPLNIPSGGTAEVTQDAVGPVVPVAIGHSNQMLLVSRTASTSVILPVSAVQFNHPITFGQRIYLGVPSMHDVLVYSDNGQQASNPIQLGGTDGGVQTYIIGNYLLLSDPFGGSAVVVSPSGQVRRVSTDLTGLPHNP